MSCCCHEDKCAAKPADGEFPQAPVVGCRRVGPDFCGEKVKVYFTRKIDAEHLKKLYALVNGEIIGKVAISRRTFPTARSSKRTRSTWATATRRKSTLKRSR